MKNNFPNGLKNNLFTEHNNEIFKKIKNKTQERYW